MWVPEIGVMYGDQLTFTLGPVRLDDVPNAPHSPLQQPASSSFFLLEVAFDPSLESPTYIDDLCESTKNQDLDIDKMVELRKLFEDFYIVERWNAARFEVGKQALGDSEVTPHLLCLRQMVASFSLPYRHQSTMSSWTSLWLSA